MARPYPRNQPAVYADEHLPELARQWDGLMGETMRRFWPQRFPRSPVEAAFGFTSNGGVNDNTATSPSHADFSEVGAFGITGGPYQLAVPNRDTSESNDWYRLHDDERVRALLGGRDACMSAHCWRQDRGGLSDQLAVGIVSLEDHAKSIRSRMGALSAPGTMWDTAMTYWAWSAGDAGAASMVRRYAPSLSGPPSRRFYDMGEAILADSRTRSLGAANSHGNPAHGWTRTAQKLRAGMALARRNGHSTSYWMEGVRDPQRLLALERSLALLAAGQHPQDIGPPPSTGLRAGLVLGATTLGAATAGVIASRMR